MSKYLGRQVGKYTSKKSSTYLLKYVGRYVSRELIGGRNRLARILGEGRYIYVRPSQLSILEPSIDSRSSYRIEQSKALTHLYTYLEGSIVYIERYLRH